MALIRACGNVVENVFEGKALYLGDTPSFNDVSSPLSFGVPGTGTSSALVDVKNYTSVNITYAGGVLDAYGYLIGIKNDGTLTTRTTLTPSGATTQTVNVSDWDYLFYCASSGQGGTLTMSLT